MVSSKAVNIQGSCKNEFQTTIHAIYHLSFEETIFMMDEYEGFIHETEIILISLNVSVLLFLISDE